MADIDVRRVRMVEAPVLGLRAARSIEREARGRRRADGTYRQRLHKVRATYPPRPARLWVLIVLSVVNLVAEPSLAGWSGGRVATVTHYPLNGPGRHRHSWRLVGVAAAIDVALLGLVFAVRSHPVVLAGVAIGVLLVSWPAAVSVGEIPAGAQLRRRTEAVVAEAPGPVHYVANLAGEPQIGKGLMQALVARADQGGLTLIGRTEQGPLVRLYASVGFKVAAEVSTRWGEAVLVVRRPQQPTSGEG